MHNKAKTKIPTLFYLVILPALLILSLAIILWCWNGLYARFAADDYQVGFQLRDLGFFDYQIWRYTNWTGRFSSTFFYSLFLKIGPHSISFLPSLLLGLLLLVWIYISKKINKLINNKSNFILDLFLATLILFGTFSTLPNLRQVLFWQAGIWTYAFPMLSLSAMILIALNNFIRMRQNLHIPIINYIFLCLLAFIGTAFSELYIPIIFILLCSLVIISIILKPKRTEIIYFFGCGLVFSVLSSILVYFAPGNTVHMADYPLNPVLKDLLRMTFENTYMFFRQQLLQKFFIILFVFLTSVLLGLFLEFNNDTKKRQCVYIFGILIIGLTLLFCVLAFAVNSWATSTYPTDRTLATPQIFFIVGLSFGGCLIGYRLQIRFERISAKLVIALICYFFIFLGPIQYLINFIKVEIPTAQLFAHQWDIMDNQLRQAKENKVREIGVNETINYYNLEQLMPKSDKYQWVNWAMSNYYEIDYVYWLKQ